MSVDGVEAFPLHRLAPLVIQIREHDVVLHQRPLHSRGEELACSAVLLTLAFQGCSTVF